METIFDKNRCPSCGRRLFSEAEPRTLSEEEWKKEARLLRAALLEAEEGEKLSAALALAKTLSHDFTVTVGKEMTDLERRILLLCEKEKKPLPEEYQAYFFRRAADLAKNPPLKYGASIERFKSLLLKKALIPYLDAAPDLLDNTKFSDEVRQIVIRSLEKELRLAPSPAEEEDLFEIDENGALLLYKGNERRVIIPDGVVEIGKEAFMNNTDVEEIEIPYGVTSIKDRAFKGCDALREVSLPEGLEYLGEGAFADCTALSEITLPSTLRCVYESCFSSSGLTSVCLPDSVSHLQRFVFAKCKSLKTVRLSPKMITVPAGTFSECQMLETVELPEGIQSIAMNAFSDCPALKELVLPNSIDQMDIFSFGMGKLTKIKEISVSPRFDAVCRFTFMGSPHTSTPFDEGTTIVKRKN